MKNIHVLPTDRPSRLFKDDNQVLNLYTHSILKGIFTNGIGSNQYIYITSDEEIKEGDWVIEFQKGDNIGEVHFINGKYVIANDIQKKIILTTDKDLDDVQAIDDEFLEWFVKNPSCEYVKVETDIKWKSIVYDQPDIEDGYIYKIIIPKEELTISDEAKQRAKNHMSLKGALEPKQETIEDAAEKIINETFQKTFLEHPKGGRLTNETIIEVLQIFFKLGAKWQAERMYSEEDMIEFGDWVRNNPYIWNYPDKFNDKRTTKELLQLWKEQQPKTLYYE